MCAHVHDGVQEKEELRVPRVFCGTFHFKITSAAKNMLSIIHHGGDEGVTGSYKLVILNDCGLFQGIEVPSAENGSHSQEIKFSLKRYVF